MNTNYNTIIKNIIVMMFIVSFGYILNSILYIYLPKQPPIYIPQVNTTLEYKIYNIHSSFKEAKKVVKSTTTTVVKQKEYPFLSNIILNAIYDLGNQSGFIIVMEKGASKTYILSINESFKGYKLKKIFPKYVIFTKNHKEYKVTLLHNNKEIQYTTLKNKPKKQTIEVQEDKVSIKRDLVDDYIQNFDKIWDNISIDEVKSKNGIDGFKVTKINPKSVFAKLGLKKGDIIKSVNNIKLKSYNDAFKVYKKIDMIKVINMVILRNNIEQEMIYEIK